MSDSRSRWTDYLPFSFHETAITIAIVAVFCFTALADSNHTYVRDWHSFRQSVVDISRNFALYGMLALGAAVVIIAGGIDLSIGATVALSAVVCTTTLLAFAPEGDSQLVNIPAYAIPIAILATLLVGVAVGTMHSWLIASVGLPPFIATLATLVGLRSFARVFVGYCSALKFGRPSAQINVNSDFFRYLRDHVEVSAIVFAIMAAITWLLLSKTVLGRHAYALGGNEQAAKLSGIRTEGVKWFAYTYCALCASIASIFFVANESVAQPNIQAQGYELTAIAAAVVGGCSLTGGVGRVQGVVLGAFFMRLVADAIFKLVKSNADLYQGMIVGVVVATAVTLSQLQELRRSQREFFPGWRGVGAIAILSLSAGLIAAMAAASYVRDPSKATLLARSGLVTGLAVGLTVLVLTAGAKFLEHRRRQQAA